MQVTRLGRPLAGTLVLVALAWVGLRLWSAHAEAWDLGRSSPVLGYDAAQYALAARTLAREGRLATTFALPVELATHARPPWPLAAVQPGLVVAEAAAERFAPRLIAIGGVTLLDLSTPRQREWLVLLLPFVCYLGLALFTARAVTRLLELHAPGIGLATRTAAGVVAGLVLLLDPEAQHFSTGGFTELPYTLGVTMAIGGLALGRAPRHPLLFGLLLGFTGAFRANMLWTAPLLALAAMLLAEPPRRARVLGLTLLGFALPLAPWWLYKWRSFGSPGWDLTRYVVWDGIEGRTWFSLFHRPELPDVPGGAAGLALLAGKAARNLAGLLLALGSGPRALWAGALLVWLLVARPARPLAVAGWFVLVHGALGLAAAAVSIPWLRYVFPSRLPLEVAGLLATWALVTRPLGTGTSTGARIAVRVAVAVLALGWGAFQTGRGLYEARATAGTRGLPSQLSLGRIARLVALEVPRGEPVMSNLGPTLAWYSHRPVIHLALTPEDVEACRQRIEFRHVVLVFRSVGTAWPGWQELMARPADATGRTEWNVRRVREYATADGFRVVWLEMDVARPRYADAGDRTPGAALADAVPPATRSGPGR